MAAGVPLDDALLGMVLGEKISSPNRVIGSKNSYANVAVGLPDLVGYIQIYVMLPETLMKPTKHFKTCLDTRADM